MHAATSVLASTVLDAPSGPKLDLLCDSRVLHPFVKIIQSFILMQNTKKRDLIGRGENFGSLFFK